MNKTKCSTKKPIKPANKGNSLQHISVSNQRFDDYRVLVTPVKSESDKKDYKVIQLANGLTACLISDNSPIIEDEESESEEYDSEELSGTEESEDENEDINMEDVEDMDEGHCRSHRAAPEQKMAAAGLCIGVGSFSDPKKVPGMAHFLEHMVFMGSKKYPKENAFDEFIKQNGGSDNASTDAETTVFYFECLEKHLPEALDRFSQFFISPLMKRDAISREREAIESEFQIALPSDSNRKEQLLCTFAKSDSPVNSFPWGNLITLKDNIDDEELYNGVHKFRKRHYSAHRMTLAVQARLPLEELQTCVLNCFSKVPSNNLPGDNFSSAYEDVFNTPEFNKIYYIKPVRDLCQVDITWALPSLKNKYKSKPHHFLAYLLGDEGKGSLLTYLKKKLWVLGTTIGNGESGIEHNSLYTFFTVNLNLTDAGYAHLTEVIEVVFSYLRMLKEIGPQQRVFDEIQAISNMAFKYAKEETAVEIVEDICEAMQFYAPEHYITGSELYFDYDPQTISSLIDYMTPDKANIMVIKKNTEGINFDTTEKWFGTQYAVRDIPEGWMSQWKNARRNEELSIPPPNSFITKDFSILPDIENNPDYPKKILANSLMEVWYRRDLKFKLPVAYYYFFLVTPLAAQDAKHACLLDTLVNMLSLDISEEIYPASSADLSHSFTTDQKGLIIKVCGFNEKLPVLIELITKHLVELSLNITEDTFEAIKDKLLKSYYNKLLKPSGISKDIRLSLLVDYHWHPIERYTAMLAINFQDLKEYTETFLKSLYLKALVQGNITETTALETVQKFAKTLNFAELKIEDRPKFNIVRLNKGEQCCRIANFNINDTNSIITNYYQADVATIEDSAIIDLVMMVIEEPLFDILRTKEQLGYHVYSSIRDTYGVLGYTITVNAQATKTTVQHVDDRIENFLKHTQKLLDDLNEEEFQKVKENTIKMKQCIDVHLKEEVDRNWSEIVAHDYMFDRIKKEIEAIEKTDLEIVKQWWQKHNSFGNKENFRKLSIQIVGFKEAQPEETTKTDRSKKTVITFLGNDNHEKRESNYFINDITQYKKTVEICNTK
ncbi:hypothetical protein GWI33_021290 [Rhynchophorus ferrugineus]|uniref:Nardilysin n=1 Tax=Rhynchophorus ferrugineus TaxID=354439 RepID=A0A834I1M1_RHYFE|nr:hypothetical protein GWI33_021290 [Rhynchophorus ferrugineus]